MVFIADELVPTLVEMGEDVGALAFAQGDVGTLTTVAGTIVPAINELKAEIDSLSGGGGATSLEDLTDVDLTTPADLDLLQMNGSGQFVNRTVATVLGSNLTALNVASTTYGRALLNLADQAALMALVPAASETVQGKVELATVAEAQTGTDSTRALTPQGGAALITQLIGAAPSDLNEWAELVAAIELGESDVAALQSGKQAAHANLSQLSGLSLIADRLPYANGTGTLALTTLTSLARNLLDDATQADMQNTLDVYSTAEIGDVTTDLLEVYTDARDGV